MLVSLKPLVWLKVSVGMLKHAVQIMQDLFPGVFELPSVVVKLHLQFLEAQRVICSPFRLSVTHLVWKKMFVCPPHLAFYLVAKATKAEPPTATITSLSFHRFVTSFWKNSFLVIFHKRTLKRNYSFLITLYNNSRQFINFNKAISI